MLKGSARGQSHEKQSLLRICVRPLAAFHKTIRWQKAISLSKPTLLQLPSRWKQQFQRLWPSDFTLLAACAQELQAGWVPAKVEQVEHTQGQSLDVCNNLQAVKLPMALAEASPFAC